MTPSIKDDAPRQQRMERCAGHPTGRNDHDWLSIQRQKPEKRWVRNREAVYPDAGRESRV
jgi:hypothetical protein